MKRFSVFLLVFGLSLLIGSHSALAQSSLWVGETYRCDATSSVMGLTSDISWTSSGGIQMTGAGFYRDVKIPRYESGTITVKCSWKYRLYGNDSWHPASKTWTFRCVDNPVSIYPTNITIMLGETYQLAYTHKFENQYTSNANAYFYSSGSVVSVTKKGLVKGLSIGKGYVNVWSDISSTTPYCTITVKEPTPTGVSLSSTELSMIVGDTHKLTASMIPSVLSSSYTWMSEDPSVAKVEEGLVTAISKGNTRIKVVASNGNFSAYCKITVKNPPIPPTSVSIPESISIIQGFSNSITPTLSPAEAETTYTWKSDNPSIVSINSSTGAMTGKSLGTANITVNTANGLSATCRVSVIEAPEDIDLNTIIQRINGLNSLTIVR